MLCFFEKLMNMGNMFIYASIIAAFMDSLINSVLWFRFAKFEYFTLRVQFLLVMSCAQLTAALLHA